MKKRPLGIAVFVIGALLLTLTGLAFGASKAAPPAGEPIVPGASYASGLSAPVSHDCGRSAQDGRCRHRRHRRRARKGRGCQGHRRRQARRPEGEAAEPPHRLPRHHRRHRVGRPRPQLAPRRVPEARREVALLRRPGHAHEVGHLRQQPARPEDRRAGTDRHRSLDDPVGRSGREVEEHPDRRLRRHGRPGLRSAVRSEPDQERADPGRLPEGEAGVAARRLEHRLARLSGSVGAAAHRPAEVDGRQEQLEAEDLGLGHHRPDEPDRRHPEARQRRPHRRS